VLKSRVRHFQVLQIRRGRDVFCGTLYVDHVWSTDAALLSYSAITRRCSLVNGISLTWPLPRCWPYLLDLCENKFMTTSSDMVGFQVHFMNAINECLHVLQQLHVFLGQTVEVMIHPLSSSPLSRSTISPSASIIIIIIIHEFRLT